MRVVYVSHNEIDSGLVRSQVLPYLRALSGEGVSFRLITFERGGPFPEGEFPRERWTGVHAARGRGLLAKLRDALAGTAVTAAAVVKERAALIHARSYLPAAIAALVGAVTRRPFLFDMRGFLPEEYRDVGLWSTRDARYRLTRAAETVLLGRAAGVIVPTRAAERLLREDARYSRATRGKAVTVLPSMVDLERFRPSDERDPIPTMVYSGTLGSWYMLDEMLAVYRAARERLPAMRSLFITRSDPEIVRDAARRLGLLDAPITIRAAEHSEMPALLSRAHVAIVLVRRSPSKLSASALKLAEYLACGLPTIVNAGLGDAGELVARHGAGHLVPEYTPAALREAGDAAAALASDTIARDAARRLAEAEFDLREGVRRYHAAYHSALRGRMPS